MTYYYEKSHFIGFNEKDIDTSLMQQETLDYFEQIKVEGNVYFVIQTEVEYYLSFPIKVKNIESIIFEKNNSINRETLEINDFLKSKDLYEKKYNKMLSKNKIDKHAIYYEHCYIDPRDKNMYGCFLEEAFSQFSEQQIEKVHCYKIALFRPFQ